MSCHPSRWWNWNWYMTEDEKKERMKLEMVRVMYKKLAILTNKGI